MENLVAQCPELKLVKKTATRTTHLKDVQDGSKHPVGHVEKLVYWTNDSGYIYTRSDLILYIKETEAYENAKKPDPSFDEMFDELSPKSGMGA